MCVCVCVAIVEDSDHIKGIILAPSLNPTQALTQIKADDKRESERTSRGAVYPAGHLKKNERSQNAGGNIQRAASEDRVEQFMEEL